MGRRRRRGGRNRVQHTKERQLLPARRASSDISVTAPVASDANATASRSAKSEAGGTAAARDGWASASAAAASCQPPITNVPPTAATKAAVIIVVTVTAHAWLRPPAVCTASPARALRCGDRRLGTRRCGCVHPKSRQQSVAWGEGIACVVHREHGTRTALRSCAACRRAACGAAPAALAAHAAPVMAVLRHRRQRCPSQRQRWQCWRQHARCRRPQRQRRPCAEAPAVQYASSPSPWPRVGGECD